MVGLSVDGVKLSGFSISTDSLINKMKLGFKSSLIRVLTADSLFVDHGWVARRMKLFHLKAFETHRGWCEARWSFPRLLHAVGGSKDFRNAPGRVILEVFTAGRGRTRAQNLDAFGRMGMTMIHFYLNQSCHTNLTF